MTDFRPIVFDRMAALGIGPSEVAYRVADAWWMTRKSAKEELPKWKAGVRKLAHWRLLILLELLGIKDTSCRVPTCLPAPTELLTCIDDHSEAT